MNNFESVMEALGKAFVNFVEINMLLSTRYLPKTRKQWGDFFCLMLRQCPRCCSRLMPRMVKGQPQFDSGETLYCLPCGGRLYPNGFMNYLRMVRNHRFRFYFNASDGYPHD